MCIRYTWAGPNIPPAFTAKIKSPGDPDLTVWLVIIQALFFPGSYNTSEVSNVLGKYNVRQQEESFLSWFNM